MDRTRIRAILDELTIDIESIADKQLANSQRLLLNLVEVLLEENEALKKTNQAFKNEINRLKGEQGKPSLRKQNHSSEKDRKRRGEQNKPRKPKIKKKKDVKIDRRVVIEFDKNGLPPDVIFKGYETRVIQDIKITTDNVEYRLPTYYSPSLKKTFIAPLPTDYQGEFGASLRSLVVTLYRDSGMTEPSIKRFLTTFGVTIAASTISRILTEGHEIFHQEKEAIIDAGLKASVYQHMDDTSCRVNGKNKATHILCNPYFTAYFTRPKKERLTILSILSRDNLNYQFDEASYLLMSELGLSDKRLEALKAAVSAKVLTQEALDELLKTLFLNPKKHATAQRIIREASAIVYYRQSDGAITHLICDDAPQFNKTTRYKSLCWIHEGRHYKKLNPVVMTHRQALERFIEQFWDYYERLGCYKKTPSESFALQLSQEFDALFSMKTGYDALDSRISMTAAKKNALLLVLQFPMLPLHNNPAELAARVQARMRDINLQTITENGTKTKDTFATIVQTAKKLGVNIYRYIHDRISLSSQMPSLAELILQQIPPPDNLALAT
jgi:hypothetical protein